MLFNSFAYIIFLPIVVALFWLTPFRFRTPLLLVASYIFYMSFKWQYGFLILAMTALNYGMGLVIDRSKARRKAMLITAIASNLLLLGYYKYTAFGCDLYNWALQQTGHQPIFFRLNILLPLGISFFVFEFIHYLTDVYKGSEPIKNPLEFALFASFFPTQIAGPIKRFQDFMPQLKTPQKLDAAHFDEGIELILLGLFKKVLLADNLAMVVQTAYTNPMSFSTADLWLASYAFAFQVYFDFSGYTDIARGSAQLLGFKVPINFDLPYMASSITDYWRRWHMSLSSWLKDYLFIPLGGSRGSHLKTIRNTLITMTLCGLWHGAGMHYIAFGFVHGALLVLHREWRRFVERVPALAGALENKFFHVLGIFLTFNAVTLTEVIFRAETVPIGISIIKRLLLLDQAQSIDFWRLSIINTQGSAIYMCLPLMLALIIVAQVLYSRLRVKGDFSAVLPLPVALRPLKPAYLALIICLLMAFSPEITPKFIYFQF